MSELDEILQNAPALAKILGVELDQKPDENTVDANWTIELNCSCPACRICVDLLDYADFWDGRKIQAVEHDTPASTGMEVVCPRCGHDFKVNCHY